MKNRSCSFLFLLLSLFFSLTIGAQSYQVSGLVEDDSGQPLIGATILEKGTAHGTVTDIYGYFTLTVSDSLAVLVVSYAGFSNQEHSLKGYAQGSLLQVSLAPAGQALEEVVVLGYGARASKPRKKSRSSSLAGLAKASAPGNPMAPGLPASDFSGENYGLINENRFQHVKDNAVSTFSIDVDAASYSNLRRFLDHGQLPPKDAIRIEEMINYFTYDYPEPQGYDPFEVVTELAECPWQPQHRLLRIGLQGMKIPATQLPPANLVFLIDVSGSMSDPQKLPLLRESFKMLVDNLRPQDKVAIVVYAGAAGLVLEPTPGTDRQKIKESLEKLEAGGSTAGGAGIQLAYKVAREHFVEGGNNRIILATDGDFNVGISGDAALVRLVEEERKSGVFLTALGFGTGNYQDHKMQQLADKGNGNHAYIDNIQEARKVLVSEFGGTLFTIAKDVKLQIEFNPARVQGYRLIGYENRLLDREDFDDDTKDAGELGAGHTVTALYEIIPAGMESPLLAQSGDLKYQTPKTAMKAGLEGEWCTIKLRYKKPDENKSKLLEVPVKGEGKALADASTDLRWAASAAEFGMLLRNSEFKGNATYDHCRRLAENALGHDPNGYRAGMVQLIEKARNLAQPEVAEKR